MSPGESLRLYHSMADAITCREHLEWGLNLTLGHAIVKVINPVLQLLTHSRKTVVPSFPDIPPLALQASTPFSVQLQGLMLLAFVSLGNKL